MSILWGELAVSFSLYLNLTQADFLCFISADRKPATHVHTCAREAQQKAADAEQEMNHPARQCDWRSCGIIFPSHAALSIHIRSHTTSKSRCLWDGCYHLCNTDGPTLKVHVYEEHCVRSHPHADLEWCYICQEWYRDVYSQGNSSFWESHCQAHFDILFSPFAERLPGSILLMVNLSSLSLEKVLGAVAPNSMATWLKILLSVPLSAPFAYTTPL